MAALKPDLSVAEEFIERLTGAADSKLTLQTFDDRKNRKGAHLARVMHGPLRAHMGALYDLQNDPAELQDRIASEPAVAERIFEEFRRRQIPVETVAELPASLDPETARRLESLGYVGD